MRERQALVDLALPEHEADVAALRALALAFIENVDLNATSLAPELRSVVSQHAELPEESEEVRVMTFHGSKGLTARVVILAGLCDGMMPGRDDQLSPDEAQADLEEQRRLFFVGVTRTTETLVLSHYSWLPTAVAMPLGARLGVKRPGGSLTVASPFLQELGHELPKAVRGQDWGS